jgi:hypothetical protein
MSVPSSARAQPSSPQPAQDKRPSLDAWFAGIGITVFFFAFAAAINFMTPSYDLKLQRVGQRVDVRLDQTLIWLVPFRQQRLTGLTDASTSSDPPKAGHWERTARRNIRGFKSTQFA